MLQLARLRFVLGLSLTLLVAVFITPVALAGPPPPPPCADGQEQGPHTNYACGQPASYLTPVQLTWTNQIMLLSNTITPPTLTGPLTTTGAVAMSVYYDCDWNAYRNHTTTNYARYGTNWAYPYGFPTKATQVGTNFYWVMVQATNTPACALAWLSYWVKIIVWSNGDSDYDGISDYQEALNGTDPKNAASVSPLRLGYWPFDNTNTWAGSAGQLPLQASNLVGVASWNTNAVWFTKTNALLKYRDVETNGNANINLRNGSVSLWFKPDWSSTNAGGVGPQAEGRLIELGTKGTTNGWWGLLVNSNGTALSFGTQTNAANTLATNLTAAINWTSNQWHQVVLTYTKTNSALYLDGQLTLTNGLGVTNYPGLAGRALGFTLGGSSAAGTNQAKGTFEDLATYNYPLSAAEVGTSYQAALSLDSDGDGWSNLLEYQLGTNPYGVNSSYGLSSTNGLSVFTPLK